MLFLGVSLLPRIRRPHLRRRSRRRTSRTPCRGVCCRRRRWLRRGTHPRGPSCGYGVARAGTRRGWRIMSHIT